MFRIFLTTLIIILSFVGISMLSEVKQADVEKYEDYPSDTHTGAGAVNAFGQLVSDGSDSSRANRGDHDDDDDEKEIGDAGYLVATGKQRESHLGGKGNSDFQLDDLDDSVDSDTQYAVEELYSYNYDEATD